MSEVSMPSSAVVMNMVSGFWLSRALWAAARLRVADHVGDEAIAVEELARLTGSRPDMLHRLLAALSAHGVFARTNEGFRHNELSMVLRSDHPESQRAYLDSVFGGEHFEAWACYETTLRTGQTAFDVRWGQPAFDWYGSHPEQARLFLEAMTATTRSVEAALLAAHEFPPFELAVDVGGSAGSLLRSLLARQPHGRGIVFDLADTVQAGAADWADTPEGARMSAVGGNFFESVPAGGDLYLLKFILHDWTDAQCATILGHHPARNSASRTTGGDGDGATR